MTNTIHGMRFRSIKRTIRKKLDSWLASIDNEELRNYLRKNVIVSGGAIATMAIGEGVNDYDIYFRTKDATREAAIYYSKKFTPGASAVGRDLTPVVKSYRIPNLKGASEERVVFYIASAGAVAASQEPYQFFESRPDWSLSSYVESLDSAAEASAEEPEDVYPSIASARAGDYSPVFFSNNAVTLNNDVQVVIRFFGEPHEIHENYDFAHCMGYYDYATDELYLAPETMQCLLERTLVYKGSLYPLCTLLRLRKFLARGWRIDAGEMLKIASNVAMVDFNNPQQLQEQLMGVDAAYMSQFIIALRKAMKEGKKITPTYFAELIDLCYD